MMLPKDEDRIQPNTGKSSGSNIHLVVTNDEQIIFLNYCLHRQDLLWYIVAMPHELCILDLPD